MSYFGEQNSRNERSNSSSSSSRRGKKSSSNSNKSNKQPQRGLGVAQLEKIRLQSQYGATSSLPSPTGHIYPNLTQEHMRMHEAYSSSPTSSPFSYNFHGQQNVVMRIGERERGYGDFQPISTASWIPGNGMLESQQFAEPNITRQFLNQQVEDTQKRRKKERNDSVGGSSSQNSETSETQGVDLELRL